MSSPPLRSPSLADWDRAMRAVEMVRERLLRATAALDAAGIPYAVCGGNAVAAWVARVDKGAVRNTPDADILLCRPELDRTRATLIAAGLAYCEGLDVPTFLDSPEASQCQAVHLFFASEKVKNDYLLPTPDVSESQAGECFRVLNLDALVRMKLTSCRRKDQVHIQDMIGVGLIDASWPARFPAELAARLQVLLDDPTG